MLACASGHNELMRYHMNEGHAALLTLELLGEESRQAGRTSIKGEDIEKCAQPVRFHHARTPVPAGHDTFPVEYMTRLFPDQSRFFDVKDASSADLNLRNVLQVEQKLSRHAGSGKTRRFGQHDLSGAEPEQFCEHGCKTAR